MTKINLSDAYYYVVAGIKQGLRDYDFYRFGAQL
jgi:hypothetical protein